MSYLYWSSLDGRVGGPGFFLYHDVMGAKL